MSDLEQTRTFPEIIEQVVNRNPNLFDKEHTVREVLKTISELVYEDAQLHTETPDMVICVLYDQGKAQWEEKSLN